MLGKSPCLGISFPVPGLMCTFFPFSYLSTYVIWHLANPTALSVPGGEVMGCFTCSTRGMPADSLAIGDCHSLLKLVFLSLLYAIKVLFYLVPLCIVSFLVTVIPAKGAVSCYPGIVAFDVRLCCVFCYPPYIGTCPLEVVESRSCLAEMTVCGGEGE